MSSRSKVKTSVLIRAGIVLISVILQIMTIFVLSGILEEYASWVYLLIEVVSIAVVFVLVNDSSSFNSFWIVIILVMAIVSILCGGASTRIGLFIKNTNRFRIKEEVIRGRIRRYCLN